MKYRINNLDLFRFIAIISVIYYHVAQRFLSAYFIYPHLINIGAYGVELFFVLSGFLIGNIYYKNAAQTNLMRFWLQRFLRTYPPYLAMLLVYSVLDIALKKGTIHWGFLIFVQNFYHTIPIFKISWSLCVEEHCYLAFPFVVLLINRVNKNKSIELICWIAACILPTILRYTFGQYGTEFGFYKTATIFRFDGIALGCFMAFLVNNYDLSRIKSNQLINAVLFGTLILLAYYLESSPGVFNYTVGYFLLVINAAALLLSLYFSGDSFLSGKKPVKRVALMAYSLYLTHATIINFADMLINKYHLSNTAASIATLIGIFITGYIFYLLIEKQSIELRNKVLRAKTA